MKQPDPSRPDPTVDEHPGRVPKGVRKRGRKAVAQLEKLKSPQGRHFGLEPDLGLGPVGSRRARAATAQSGSDPAEAIATEETTQAEPPVGDSLPRGPGLGSINSVNRPYLSPRKHSAF